MNFTKEELHEHVAEYCLDWQGEAINITYLYDAINDPTKRDSEFCEYLDWMEDTVSIDIPVEERIIRELTLIAESMEDHNKLMQAQLDKFIKQIQND